MSVKINKFGLVGILIVTVLMLAGRVNAFAEYTFSENASKNQKAASKVLYAIDRDQENYFAIVKRNDVLLKIEYDKKLGKDRKDLNKLVKKVKKQVTNKYYLKKYKDIQKRYAKCDDITDIGMEEFAEKNYNEVDDLLNEVYEEVKSKISPEDFKNLAKSEDKWLKEVENCYKVFSSIGYGTIGTLIYYDYQINMREFRALLLMRYL